jgi:hypothetical protein
MIFITPIPPLLPIAALDAESTEVPGNIKGLRRYQLSFPVTPGKLTPWL